MPTHDSSCCSSLNKSDCNKGLGGKELGRKVCLQKCECQLECVDVSKGPSPLLLRSAD
jgi:hypothetical protein